MFRSHLGSHQSCKMKAALPAFYDINGTQTPIFCQGYYRFLVKEYCYKCIELVMLPNTEKCAFAKLITMMIQGNRNAYVITILVTHIAIKVTCIWWRMNVITETTQLERDKVSESWIRRYLSFEFQRSCCYAAMYYLHFLALVYSIYFLG